jgi:DNA-binding MurR/RpiR family transcriptional regulator
MCTKHSTGPDSVLQFVGVQYGVGLFARVASDAACKFLRIGVRASVFDDSQMMLMSACLLDKTDVALAFSHSGQIEF